MHPVPRVAPAAPPPAGARTPCGTRDALRAAAARRFAAHGYHRTCLDDVARDVGIRKASIFHHFAGKEALYRAVVAEGHGEVEAIVRRALAADGGWLARLRRLLEAYVDLVAAHPEHTRILVRQSLGDAPDGWDGRPDSERLLGMVGAFLAEGQRAGAFAPLDAQSLVLGVVGMVTFFFTSAPVVAPGWRRARSDERHLARLRRHVTTVVLRALAPAAGLRGG